MSQVREERQELLKRLPHLRLLFLIVLALVACRFWFVQAVRGDYYRELAENNRMRKVELKAPRGLIYDRHGRLLVENIPSYQLLLDRSRSRDPRRALEFAAATLDRSPPELEATVERQHQRSHFHPVLLAEDLSLSQVARFSSVALEYPEFEIDVGHLRLYRYGPMTAHLLGYLGEVSKRHLQRPGSPFRAGDLVGRKGIEEAFDEHLRGSNGERVVIVDSHGRLKEEYQRRPSIPGEELTTALDLDLQQEAARFFEGKAGAVVALDPRTGGVRVMLSAPTFNPNLFSRRLGQTAWRELVEAPDHPLQDRALQSTYSPGSVFKIVMSVAGLSEGVIGPRSRVYCNGAATFYNRQFRCWRRGGHGWVDLRAAIKESCDVFFYHLGKELGISRIARYSRQLGLGRPAEIQIPGEKAGLVPDPEWSQQQRRAPWYPGETISVAIGQGPLLVTPLQLASLMATIFNGGYRIVPTVEDVQTTPELEPVGVDEAVLATVRDALWAVVNDQGTGARARVPGLAVSGKTGTVQVIRQATRIESQELPYKQRDHAWFAAFATGGDRQLVVVVFVEHGGKGSQAAAPLAKKLYETYFRDVLDRRQPA